MRISKSNGMINVSCCHLKRLCETKVEKDLWYKTDLNLVECLSVTEIAIFKKEMENMKGYNLVPVGF